MKQIFTLFMMLVLVGTSFSQVKNNEASTQFKVIETLPEYPGGEEAMLDDIYSNFKYPTVARENGVEGRVIVQFTIDTTGMLVNEKIIKSLSPELDAEVLRLVRELKQFTPATQRGKKVRVSYNLPMDFSLDDGELLGKEMVDLDSLSSLGWALDFQFLMGKYHKDLNGLLNMPLGWGTGISFYKKRMTLDFRVNYLFSKVKEDFSYQNTLWEKKRLGSHVGLDINVGYKILNTKKINLAPFVGIGYSGYLPWKPEEGAPVKSLLSPVVNAGLMLDFKRKYRQFSAGNYNYQMIRAKIWYSPIFLKEDYSGAIINVGIGYGLFMSRFE